jgi:hypothetical protein
MKRTIWLDTVRRIGESGAQVNTMKEAPPQDHKKRQRAASRRWDGTSQPTVRIIDIPSPVTLTVSWCDPCTGRFDDQTWRAGVARHRGVCVLSAYPINAGDAIYSPYAKGTDLPNAGAMILAGCVDVSAASQDHGYYLEN